MEFHYIRADACDGISNSLKKEKAFSQKGKKKKKNKPSKAVTEDWLKKQPWFNTGNWQILQRASVKSKYHLSYN